jgi:RND family efflux transporter MFP subunit
LWAVAGVLLVLGAGVWAGVVRPWEPKPIKVAVETVVPGPASRILAVNGRIEAQTQVDVKPTVGGQLKSVDVAEGDRVKAGDLLATLDDAQQQSAVAQTNSALDAAQAQLQQAKINFERARSLGDSISRSDLDKVQLALQTAQNEVDRLGAAQTQALSLLAEYSIKAPFDGTVLTRGVDPGQVVSNTTVLFAFADLEHLRAQASIDEVYSAEIRRGLAARLQPSGYNRTFDGEVSFVSPTVDASTGGRLIRVSIDDTAGLALPIGLTVNLNIVVDELADVITVPRAAILEPDTAPAVLVLEAGKAVRRPIEFVDWPSARLIVSSGLAAGDQVIADPKGVADGALAVAKAG